MPASAGVLLLMLRAFSSCVLMCVLYGSHSTECVGWTLIARPALCCCHCSNVASTTSEHWTHTAAHAPAYHHQHLPRLLLYLPAPSALPALFLESLPVKAYGKSRATLTAAERKHPVGSRVGKHEFQTDGTSKQGQLGTAGHCAFYFMDILGAIGFLVLLELLLLFVRHARYLRFRSRLSFSTTFHSSR
ncbi:uncharacterized protein K489DRAFT_398862 [Dissoconium aciculare CBS 342.82]|uniref:Copper transporter n=1 Tax=Dissoconium aciculare CBS 342.82 TaxID=1314786 RepID=A0A6J3MF61_9PEZI|nr:uncharacterized protein K489DRAFT_398862 [Dissoconium aciculare CBS 342.82]KAF1826610.1 hypothetical protein K489DRAFT_398862 [Dissoconium aciculare CBS 342.82]